MLKESHPPATKIKNPIKAIRVKCLDCSGDSRKEVEFCTLTACSLYPFRMGRNPFRTQRAMTDSQKAEIRVRLQAARERKFSLSTNKEVLQ